MFEHGAVFEMEVGPPESAAETRRECAPSCAAAQEWLNLTVALLLRPHEAVKRAQRFRFAIPREDELSRSRHGAQGSQFLGHLLADDHQEVQSLRNERIRSVIARSSQAGGIETLARDRIRADDDEHRHICRKPVLTQEILSERLVVRAEINCDRLLSRLPPDMDRRAPEDACREVAQLLAIDARQRCHVVTGELGAGKPRRRACPQHIEQRESVAVAVEDLRHHVVFSTLAEKLLAVAAKHIGPQLPGCLDASALCYLHRIRVGSPRISRFPVQRRRHQVAVLEIAQLQAQLALSLLRQRVDLL